MKLQVTIISVIANIISAAVENAVLTAVRSNSNLRKDRNLNLILGSSLDTIRTYGCWCNFLSPVGNGKGHPIDSVDGLCKTLSEGYQCAMMDVETATGVDDCIPWTVDYNSGTGGGAAGLVSNCQALNSELCAQFACMVEGTFSLNVINEFLSFGAIDPANAHINNFDFNANCPTQSGTQTDLRECCGQLPFRFPFKPVNKECCGAQVYDPSLMDCCNDDVPRFSCV